MKSVGGATFNSSPRCCFVERERNVNWDSQSDRNRIDTSDFISLSFVSTCVKYQFRSASYSNLFFLVFRREQTRNVLKRKESNSFFDLRENCFSSLRSTELNDCHENRRFSLFSASSSRENSTPFPFRVDCDRQVRWNRTNDLVFGRNSIREKQDNFLPARHSILKLKIDHRTACLLLAVDLLRSAIMASTTLNITTQNDVDF